MKPDENLMFSKQSVSKGALKKILCSPLYIASRLGLYSARSAATTIIFDLGGVLFSVNLISIYRRAGLLKLFWYTLKTWKSPRTIFFNLLNDIPLSHMPKNELYDTNGFSMPRAMTAWVSGLASCQEIISSIENLFEQKPDYCSDLEKEILLGIAHSVFSPEILANATTLNEQGISFLRHCIAQRYKVYVLSNWDHESFALIRKRYADFFDLFDGVIISGEINLAKPDPAIFHHILDQYKLDPRETVFIDDQPENVESAQQVGLTVIKCPDVGWWGQQNFNRMRKEFELWQMERALNGQQECSVAWSDYKVN